MTSFRQKNIAELEKKNPFLAQKISSHMTRPVCRIIQAPSGFVLEFDSPDNGHSPIRVYPQPDASQSLDKDLEALKNKNQIEMAICIFIGMGVDYHRLSKLILRQDLYKIIILEPDMDLFCLALDLSDLTPIFSSPKVEIFAGDIDWERYQAAINNKKIETNFLFNALNPLFQWKPDLYTDTRNRAKAFSVTAISSTGVLEKYGNVLFKNRFDNLTLIREANTIDPLKDIFKNRPAIIVSAGPSLTNDMDRLKQAAGKAVMIAADSATVPLLKNGITPDFVTCLDFRELNAEKLSPDIVSGSNFSLITTITSSPLVPKRLDWPHLFFCFQENDTQGWLFHALDVHHGFRPMLSVPMLSLQAAQYMGADPIILLGHDFALTSTQTDHAGGAVFSHGWHTQQSKFIKIPGVDGRELNTLPHLLEFKQNFERMLEQADRNYINATSSGAQIRGTRILSLETAIHEHLLENIPVNQILGNHVQTKSKQEIQTFILQIQAQAALAKKALNRVSRIIKQNTLVLQLLKNLHPSPAICRMDQLPQKIRLQKQKLNDMAAGFDPFLPIEEVAAPKLLKANQLRAAGTGKDLLENLEKESRIISIEMDGHREGLSLFIRLAEDLISHLKTENNLLTRLKKENVSEKDLSRLSELYLTSQDSVKAKKILERQMAEHPDSGEAAMNMGECLAQLLDFDRAFEFWDAAVQARPGLKSRVRAKQTALAGCWADKAKEMKGYFVEKYHSRMLNVCRDGNFCRKQEKELWPFSRNCILGLIHGKELTRAENLLSLWEPIKTQTPEWYYLMAKIQSEKGEIHQALTLMEKALDKESYPADWLAFSARLLLESGQFDQGISRLEKAVKLDPAQAALWEELGDTLFELRHFDTASVAYEKCILALPERLEALRKYGDCCARLNQNDQAETAYLAVLEKDSQNQAARDGLLNLEKSRTAK